MRIKRNLAIIAIVGAVFWLISSVWSEPIKPLIYYTKTGKGLGNRTYTFRFSFWDAETGSVMV